MLICEYGGQDEISPIMTANTAALALLKQSMASLIGRDFRLFLVDPGQWEAIRTQIAETGQAVIQTILSVHGSQIPATLSATRFQVREDALVVVVIDAAQEQRSSNPHVATLAAMVESSDDAIIGTTVDGVITSWNIGAERLYGYEAHEVLGRSFAVIVPENRREEMERILEDRRHGKRIEHLETERKRKDGRLLEVSLTISPVIDRDGRVIGASSIGRDITERKKLQKQIAEVQIREQIEIGAELHDSLGQGVTAIGMLARSLQHRLGKIAPYEAATAQAIVGGIDDMEIQLRSLAKGLMPVSLDQQGLDAALEDLAQQSTQRYRIPCRLRCGHQFAVGDTLVATQLFRIAQEAVHNAARHAKPDTIEISLVRRNGNLVMSVRDDGRGIEQEVPGAPGLGIRIMKHRASLIGATLSLSPRKRKGTMVRCVVPERAMMHESEVDSIGGQKNPVTMDSP